MKYIPILTWAGSTTKAIVAFLFITVFAGLSLGCDSENNTSKENLEPPLVKFVIDPAICKMLRLEFLNKELSQLTIEGATLHEEVRKDNKYSTRLYVPTSDTISIYGNPTYLVAYNCGIVNHDIRNSALSTLVLANNQLPALDTEEMPNLQHLDITGNKIMSLRLHNNSRLTHLRAANNLLHELDLTKNPYLMYLDCSNNGMIALKLDGLTKLTDVYCQQNVLDKLVIGYNLNLHTLHCENNCINDLRLAKTKIGKAYLYNPSGTYENNRFSLDQLRQIVKDGWKIYEYNKDKQDWTSYDYEPESESGS